MRNMMLAVCGAASCFALPCGSSAFAANPNAEDFYKGVDQMKMVVSARPGGTYDTYGRLLARHIAEHIPGNPNIISTNMGGASGVEAANYVANIAPKDGSIITNVRFNFPMYQALGVLPVKADMRAFHWLGSFNATNHVLFTFYTSPVDTLEKAKKTQVVLGAASPRSNGVLMCHIFNALLGTKFKVITGYGGLNGVRLAMHRGEVQGACEDGWSDLKTDFSDEMSKGQLNIILQMGMEKEPDLPKVPLLIDQGKTPQEKAVLAFITENVASMGKPFATSPGVPSDRVAVLRHAFDNTMKDPAFLKDAKRIHVHIDPISGQTIQKLVSEIIATPKPVLQKVRTVMGVKEGQAIQ